MYIVGQYQVLDIKGLGSSGELARSYGWCKVIRFQDLPFRYHE